jgi:hypothetical protein
MNASLGLPCGGILVQSHFRTAVHVNDRMTVTGSPLTAAMTAWVTGNES